MMLMGTVTQETYQNYICMNDKMLGPTVDPSDYKVHQVVGSIGPSHG